MFMEQFKYYKARKPPPDLKDVLDFNQPSNKVNLITTLPPQNSLFGLIPPEKWKVYELVNHPGFIFISNPFTKKGQRYWIVRSLRDYTKKPNKLNIDCKEWWNNCQCDKDLINKLRWATLGYHHDWDTKIYSEDSKHAFPKDLSILCNYVAGALGYRDFKAEAAIVNYYHMDSTLSGHTDHSEENLEAPLFSFSFGQTAVFLLGGVEKESKPTALFLQSGDIAVMSKESRLCYHGVPKILFTDNKVWDNIDQHLNSVADCFESDVVEKCEDENFWSDFENYLNTSRININVRQVLNSGQKRLGRMK